MAVKLGLSTGDMRNNSISSTSGVYAASSTSTGRTRSQTPRCWRGHSSPASFITTMRKAQTRWAGHAFQMSDSRIPQQLLYGELSQGARKVGGQHKRLKDSLKAYLKDFNINITTWKNAASNKLARRSMIHKGSLHSEVQRSNAAKEKRLEPKTPSIRLPLSGARPVVGASMPTLATSGHSAECSQMSLDMVIFVIELTNSQTVN